MDDADLRSQPGVAQMGERWISTVAKSSLVGFLMKLFRARLMFPGPALWTFGASSDAERAGSPDENARERDPKCCC